MNSASLTLRPSTPADEPLLFRLFADNKAREFAALGLGQEQLQPLLAMQYRARRTGYASAFPEARQVVIEENSNPVGQVLLSEDAVSIHIVDIAIAAGQQSRGLGTAVLQEVQERAARDGKELRLQAIPQSAAQRLYERLGFVVAAHGETAHEMVWMTESNVEVANA